MVPWALAALGAGSATALHRANDPILSSERARFWGWILFFWLEVELPVAGCTSPGRERNGK